MVFYGFNISQKVLSSDWPLCFNIKNHELNCEEEMKYLGVVLDETLIYKQHINQLNKKLSMLTNKMYHHTIFFNQKTLVRLCKAYVAPVLFYGVFLQ